MSIRPIERVQSKIAGLKRSGDSGRQWKACCPAHDDAHQSLAVSETRKGVVLLKCYRGCSVEDIVASIGLSMRDLYPGEETPEIPLSVALLAWDKRIPVEFLRDECKLEDGKDGKSVRIPYGIVVKNKEGQITKRSKQWKIRTSLTAKDGSRWPTGVPTETYGQWELDNFRSKGNHLILVEGESDCWALWYHGFAALGVPGANNTAALKPDQVDGFTRITVWKEPDAGGEPFLRGIAQRLAEFSWQGELRVINAGAVKDPCALHQQNPEGFPEAFRALLESAEVVDVTAIAGPGGARKKSEAAATKSKHVIPGSVKGVANDPSKPTPMPAWFGLTDLGNAQRLVFRHGKDLRYCQKWKKWLAWNGRLWIVDAKNIAVQKAVDTVRSIYAEAQAAESVETRTRLFDHAVKSESARAIYAMVDLAESDPQIGVKVADMDKDNWILNCPNCQVDLRTGEAKPHDRDSLITKQCATSFNPDAQCPQWEKFLRDVFRDDAEMVAYVQRLLGYCLTGDVSTHMLAVFWGGGGNGKGTLLNTILYVMGESYSCAAVSDLLMARKEQRQYNEIADLHGKRLVVCQETDDGCRLNESLVKWLTGGDKLKARRLYEDLWEFEPTHKIILSTNYRPKVRGTDRGIWRRLRLIPFTVTFAGKAEDPGLPGRLKEEAQGILAWLVRGCLDWYRHGENQPEAVQIATSEYQATEDVIQRFIADCCETGNEALRCEAGVLYAAYQTWVERSNEGHPVSQHKFGRRMNELGYTKIKNNNYVYVGIALGTSSSVVGVTTGRYGVNGKPGSVAPFDLSSLDE